MCSSQMMVEVVEVLLLLALEFGDKRPRRFALGHQTQVEGAGDNVLR